MVSIKKKLQSSRGASMIMAMVFLLVCMLIGGSVLAMATANGSRIENMAEDQQEYYSQRSAMLLLSDILTGEDGQELQVLVTDVTVTRNGADPERTISISSPNLPDPVPCLQRILLENVVASYLQEVVPLTYSDLNWIASENPTLAPAAGTVYMACTADIDNHLAVSYKIHTPDTEGSQDYSLELDFGENRSHFVMTMAGTVNTGDPSTVAVDDMETTTTTTVIRWSLPDIQKGQYTATGGNEA